MNMHVYGNRGISWWLSSCILNLTTTKNLGNLVALELHYPHINIHLYIPLNCGINNDNHDGLWIPADVPLQSAPTNVHLAAMKHPG